MAIGTGGTKGVYYAYGKALAQVMTLQLDDIEATTLTTGGSIDNLRLLADGDIRLAFTAADAAEDAYSANGAFTERLPIRALARVYDDYIHLVVRASSQIRGMEDLRGHVVSLGPPGSGTALIARRLLRLAGVDPATVDNAGLSIDESINALRNGRVDAFFWSGGLPTSGMAELASQTAIRLVPLDQLAGPMRAEYGAAYRSATIPKGTYSGVTETQTIAVPNYLVTADTIDEELIYQATRLLFKHKAAMGRYVPAVRLLNARTAVFTQPIPLHPGALRYYRASKP